MQGNQLIQYNYRALSHFTPTHTHTVSEHGPITPHDGYGTQHTLQLNSRRSQAQHPSHPLPPHHTLSVRARARSHPPPWHAGPKKRSETKTHRHTLGFPWSEHVITCAESLVDSGCPMASGAPRLPQEAFGCHINFVFELGGSDSLAQDNS